jgi:hypothetical protein
MDSDIYFICDPLGQFSGLTDKLVSLAGFLQFLLTLST